MGKKNTPPMDQRLRNKRIKRVLRTQLKMLVACREFYINNRNSDLLPNAYQQVEEAISLVKVQLSER